MPHHVKQTTPTRPWPDKPLTAYPRGRAPRGGGPPYRRVRDAVHLVVKAASTRPRRSNATVAALTVVYLGSRRARHGRSGRESNEDLPASPQVRRPGPKDWPPR